MNNKKLGSNWEKEACSILASKGYWVHFISPDSTGAQPFDIIAVKDDSAVAIDCKTAKKRWFGIERLEDNQIFAFNKWLKCGNNTPQIFVKYMPNDEVIKIKMIPYSLIIDGKVNLDEFQDFE